MRKNVLALGIAAMIGGLGMTGVANAGSFAGVAEATLADQLRPNGDGIGHSLVVPYFTTQNGQATLISVVNTDTAKGKVLKVRFRGASNSDDVFDFTLFLSPGDVWNGNISAKASGDTLISNLSTGDASCTLPASVRTNGAAGTNFVTARLPADVGAAGTREGYVEIFNMADLIDVGANSIFDAIKHVGNTGVAPCTQATLNVLGDYANIDTVGEVEALGFRAPTTGLTGQWSIIDVPNSTTYSGSPVAVQAVVAQTGVPATGRLTLFSQTSAPVTDLPTVQGWTADPLLRAGLVEAAQYDFPDMSTPYVGTGAVVTESPLAQAYLLTQSFAVNSVMNEFYTGDQDGLDASTDWVFTMPTRRYNVAVNYAATPVAAVYSDYTLAAALITPGAPVNYFAPFANNAGNIVLDTTAKQLCVTGIGTSYTGREEQTPGAVTTDPIFVVSPGTPDQPLPPVTFCGEASVLSFNATVEADSSLSGAIARKDIMLEPVDGPLYTSGWVSLQTPGLNGIGLPVVGSSFFKAKNPAAQPGMAATYGMSFQHKVTRPVVIN